MNIFHKIKRSLWQERDRKTKIILVIVMLCLAGRSLPYFAPIRASELNRGRRAFEFADRHGLPLGTILTRDREHTVTVPLKQVSPDFIRAILAAEDGRFYEHGAIELRAIARAILQAIQHKKITSGASTITMQLARMLEPAPRTLPVKVREIWRSWRLSAGMNKDEILHAYLNRLPMGGNIYGVEAAARIYFGIPASELDLARASLLAAIPNDPTRLIPYDYSKALKKRQKYVLDRMVEDGYITRARADKVFGEEIALQPRQQGILAAPHFLFWLAEELPPEHSARIIKTTIDRPLQEFVEAQVKEVIRALEPHDVRQAAALVLDNRTGEVLAYVGSSDYFAEDGLGRNDGVRALRQPGSTLKPFLYQLALDRKIVRPNTVLADVPAYYAIPGARIYSPKDYSERFSGPVRIRIALANSLNIPAVRTLERVGVDVFLEMLHQLGFTHLDRTPQHYGLGLALGSAEVSLWELARAYFVMARQGQPIPLVTTLSPSTSTVTPAPPSSEASRTAWAIVTDMLGDRHARARSFGVDSVLNLPFPVAVKTGTSSNFRDTWTVGFTTDYTVATWTGNFDGAPMRQVSGVMGAAPLWQRIMLRLHEESRQPAPFPVARGAKMLPICALSGSKPTPACPVVVREYFYLEDLKDYETRSDKFYRSLNPKTDEYGLDLPKEYNEWLATQPSSTIVPSRLAILFPNEGDTFLIPPNPSREHGNETSAKLQFKIVSGLDRPVEWWLNGQKLGTNSDLFWFWQLRPGKWTLEVKSGSKSDRVSFQVRPASNQSDRWGFSVKNSSPN